MAAGVQYLLSGERARRFVFDLAVGRAEGLTGAHVAVDVVGGVDRRIQRSAAALRVNHQSSRGVAHDGHDICHLPHTGYERGLGALQIAVVTRGQTVEQTRHLDGACQHGSGHRTHEVGTKLPNPFGLHDMHGNVSEWCEDVYREDFYTTPEAVRANPLCEAGSDRRVVRSGSYSGFALQCRSAIRYYSVPERRDSRIGLRPAASLDAKH